MSRTVKLILATAALAMVFVTAGIAVAVYLAVSHFNGIQSAQKGYRAVADGQYDAAISYFDAALKTPLGNYQRSYVYLNRATACAHKRRFTESIHDETEALRLNPKLTFAYEGRAWAHHENGERDKELADLNEALRRPSNSEYAYHARGMIYYDRKDYDRALPDFEEAVRCNPASVEPLLMRARCYLAKDELDPALASFDAAISMDPENARTYEERARVYKRKGEQEKSAQDLAQAAQLTKTTAKPDDSTSDTDSKLHLLMLRQHAAYDAHNFDRAIEIVNEAIATKPNPEWTSQFVMDRGNTYSAKGDKKKAMSDYDEAIVLNPKNGGAYVNRARLLGRDRHYAEALKDYDAAIKLNPQQWEAYYNRAVDLQECGKATDALADLDKVIALNPTFVSAYLRRADIHMRRHETEEAIRDCDAAASVEPMSVVPYRARATAHLYRKDYPSAIHDLETAAGLEKNQPEAWLNSLAWLWATCPDSRARDGQKAITAAKKACELTKWMVWENIDTLAAAYAEAGQFPDAIKYQKKAIAMAPRDNKSVPGMRARLKLYQRHEAYREDPKG